MTVATKSEDVIHLHGNLYRVRLDQIQFAEPDENSEVLTFSNPRHVLKKLPAKGFSKEEMSELRETIQKEGLKNPILLRWTDIDDESILQIVDGERRTRSLLKLYSENVQCYDPTDEVWRPAKEMYEYVECRINNMDDIDAFTHAFSGNERAVGIGDGATIALIREFRQANWTDDQILKVTGKSVTWLRDTDALINLDDQTFEALTKDQINRTVALELSKIEDIEHRLDVLGKAQAICAARIENLMNRIDEEIEEARTQLDIAESDRDVAIRNDDPEFLDEAEEEIQDATTKIQAKTEVKEKVQKSSNKVTKKDLQKARKTAGNGDAGRISLTRAKIQKLWYQPVVELIKNEGLNNDGEEAEIDLEDARLVKLLCEKIENGDGDILQILESHLTAKSKRSE